MTVSQLYNSVAQLGFENSLEEDSRFIFAVNRALLQVNSIRPATKAYLINHKCLENKIKNATFEPVEKKNELCFYADNVKSYYFETDGNGSVLIEKLDSNTNTWVKIGSHEFSNSKNFTAYRGFIKQDGAFIKGSVRLRFIGEYLYSVKSVAMYEFIYSAKVEDIPAYEPFVRYDISSLVDDFLSLSTPPIIEAEGISYINQDYSVENGRAVLLSRELKGVFKVLYNKKPPSIIDTDGLSEDNTVIALDDDLCALLPVLVASYIWLEDEPEKAQYYLALYRENAIDVERRARNVTPIPIKSCNGW